MGLVTMANPEQGILKKFIDGVAGINKEKLAENNVGLATRAWHK